MNPRESTPAHSSPQRRPFQYSLRTMLIITTAFAVVCACLFGLPEPLNALAAMFFVVAFPMSLTVGLVYGRGYQRTFCIGAIFPAVAAAYLVLTNTSWDVLFLDVFPGAGMGGGFFQVRADLPEPVPAIERSGGDASPLDFVVGGVPWNSRLRVATLIFVDALLCVVSGLLAMGLRWMIERSHREHGQQQPPSPTA